MVCAVLGVALIAAQKDKESDQAVIKSLQTELAAECFKRQQVEKELADKKRGHRKIAEQFARCEKGR